MSESNLSAGSGTPEARTQRWRRRAVGLALAAMVWVIYGQTRHFAFINYDDPDAFFNNPIVNHGLNWPGVVWTFTHENFHEWFPVTYLSRMVDSQFFGPTAGGPHLVNALLHALTAILLFLTLEKMTGAFWRPAIAAALFAVHPLRVESVAWVVERKDVLSGLFFMLTLWAWTGYVQKPPGRHRLGSYGLALTWFMLGLMSKSVLVTTPVILLLLDVWPLQRLPAGGLRAGVKAWRGLLLEKVPFGLLSASSCLITMLTESNVMLASHTHSLFWRIGNVALGYVSYLAHAVYPANLAVIYTYSNEDPSPGSVGLALLLLAAISAAAVARLRKQPCLLVGWGWFLIMLLPTIDTMAATQNTRADRYTYLPQMGLCLLATWGVAGWLTPWPHRRLGLGMGAALVLSGLLVAAHIQTGYWQDSVAVWTHTLACTSHNSSAENNLGSALVNQGNPAAAIPHFERALEYKDNCDEARLNLGIALADQGAWDAASHQFARLLQVNPDSAEACYHMGGVLLDQGRLAEAIRYDTHALQFKPDYPEAHYDLGYALGCEEKWAEAIPHYEQALHQKLDRPAAQYITAVGLAAHGHGDGAVPLYEQVLLARPDFAEAHYRLGLALASQNQTARAVAQFQTALTLAGAQDNAALAETLRAQLAARSQPKP